MTPIATPVFALCLLVTRAEVDDGPHSTVLSQELAACTVCNSRGEVPCEVPPSFVTLMDKLNAVKPAKPAKRVVKRGR